MSDIELKKGVDQIADGEISKDDADFVKQVFEKTTQDKDKNKNYFQEYVKNNTQTFDKTMQDIAIGLEKYLQTNACDDATVKSINEFIARLKNEKNILSGNIQQAPQEQPKPTEDKTKIEYKSESSLQSNIDIINKQLQDSGLESKKIAMSAEEMRTNLRTNVMKQVEKELKSTLKINDKKLQNGFDSKTEAVYKFLYESFESELKKNNRLDNLIVAGMYVTINGIKQKMEAPKLGNADFNLVGANILSNIKDINTFLSANGDIMGNLFKNSQDKIVKKIKENFPKEAIQKMQAEELNNELGNMKPDGFYVNIGNYKNPITDIFEKDIKINTELEAIQFIETNNGITEKTTAEKLGGTGSGVEINKQLSQKLDAILKEVPTKPHEQEAFKTELIQNKFSGWSKDILQAVYDFAEKLGLGSILKMFNKDGLFEKVLLSKSRNDAKNAVEKVFNATKTGEKADFITGVAKEEKLKDIVEKLDVNRITLTLNETKKYIKPVLVENGKEVDNKARKDLFMDASENYTHDKIKTQFKEYITNIDSQWNTRITSMKSNNKDEAPEIRHQYTLHDIITKDSDLVEHFLQYVQTGLYPSQYTDRKAWENLQNIGIKPEAKTDNPKEEKASDEKKNEVIPPAPTSPEKKSEKKEWEEQANEYAKKVKNGKVHTSKLWTDSVYVEFTGSKGQTVKKMFKSPNAKRIT